MSIHANLTPEALQRLHAQRRNSTISSLVIAFLVVVLVALLLGVFLLPNLVKETPTIVTYESSLVEENEVKERKVNTSMERKPSSPSSAMTKVIAANTTSPTAIPVPDTDVEAPSVEFGDGDDFGSGWGDGDGTGAGGDATFFNQSVKAERIAYVIDYSASMRGKREELMREELKKSVSGLKSGMKYQMIYFAGPAWVAGDELEFSGKGDEMGKSSPEAEVKTADGKKYKLEKKGGWQVPTNYRAKWLDVTSDNLKNSRKIIKDHSLVYGTEWSKPLEMAMDMDPAPQIIFFMTDGTGGTVNKVKELATKAKRKQIVINSIAMMMPSTADAMAALANGTGGVFTIIDEKGRAKEVKPK